ncbi:hypothetical protein J6590_023385, partial [Homalodisca vitripennis]
MAGVAVPATWQSIDALVCTKRGTSHIVNLLPSVPPLPTRTIKISLDLSMKPDSWWSHLSSCENCS